MSDGTKSEAPLILGVSGLRGIVGESLTPEVAMRYAAAVGAWFAEQDPYEDCCELVIAHDGRAGYEPVYFAAIAGLLGAGWAVRPLGRAMTPTVGHAIDNNRYCAGGLVVTASHNPKQWNGLKCISAVHSQDGARMRAAAPASDAASSIIERFNTGDITYEGSEDLAHGVPRGSFRSVEILDADGDVSFQHARAVRNALGGLGASDLLQAIDQLSDDRHAGYRVVADSVNASGAVGTARLQRELELDLVQLFGDDRGIFPHTPEPTAENLSGEGGLCDAVPGLKADVGFAQDPDGDRLAIVDEKGNYIGEEYTLALCAEAVLSAGRPPAHAGGSSESASPVIVVNLSTSRMVEDVAAAHGAVVVRTPVGEANVVERMKQLKEDGREVVLGGEGNGGVIWPEVVYVRDSLSSMALVLSLMARTGKSVSQLVEQINELAPGGRGYAIVKRKVDIPTKAHAQPAVEAVAKWAKGVGGAKVDLQDGVRVDVADWRGGGSAWVHVRASNTEPIMRLIAEAGARENAEALLAAVEDAIGGG